MNMFKKGLLATAAAVTLGIGAMGSAYADTYATSILQIQNLQLLRSDGVTQFTAGDFINLSGTNDAHVTATLNGVSTALADSVPIPGPGPSLGSACQGPGCGIANAAIGLPPGFGVTGVLSGTFGYAAQALNGSVITPGGATAQTRADAATNANFNIASGNSDVGTSTTFQFAVAEDTSITFDFTADAYTDAKVIGASGPTANANARLSWSVNIVDVESGDVVYSFAPDALNAESLRSATDENPGTDPYAFTYHYTIADAGTTASLLGDRLYQLTIQHNTLANVLQEEVPEPATLAIVAAGLLSMSLASRRRKS